MSTLFLNKSLLLLGLPCYQFFLYIVRFYSIIYFQGLICHKIQQPTNQPFDITIKSKEVPICFLQQFRQIYENIHNFNINYNQLLIWFIFFIQIQDLLIFLQLYFLYCFLYFCACILLDSCMIMQEKRERLSERGATHWQGPLTTCLITEVEEMQRKQQ